MKLKKLGFPVIHNFPGDIREFTPSLFKYLSKFELDGLYLEKGYGSRLGYSEEDYYNACPNVKFVEMKEVYEQEALISLKNPDLSNLKMLIDGTVLFSMLHYETRESLVELLRKKEMKSFSMDSIVDDYGIRMFVDYFRTSFSGCEKAFNILKHGMEDFYSSKRQPIIVTVVGAGGVGQAAVRAFEILGDGEFLNSDSKGLLIQVVTQSVLKDGELLKTLLQNTNVLVDASRRSDYSKEIINNEMLGYLPTDAVILDLSADRYDDTVSPTLVKGFEGTVKGSPECPVIFPDDILYEYLPANIDSKNRRITVSCDAWPSMKPQESIKYYEILMKNYLNVLLTKDLEKINPYSDDIFERGLYRSTLDYFLKGK